MKIGLFHGYELKGSGSNEYVRYLAQALVASGQEVHIICREPSPESIPFVDKAIKWHANGDSELLFEQKINQSGYCALHQLPMPAINAVYLTDKQRPGNVKAFSNLTNEELQQYHHFVVNSLIPVLKKFPLDILHTNHIIYQPIAAAEACEKSSVPFIIFPHGSAIEYSLRKDERYKKLALEAIIKAAGLIIGNHEVLNRLLALYPDFQNEILSKTKIVGVGVDTALFKPVEKSKRSRSIEQISSAAPFNGKPPHLLDELKAHLDDGDFEFITKQRNSYQNKYPDADLTDKLACIPWESGNILLFVGALTVGKGIQTLITALPFILEKNSNTHLLIVGSGAYREVLESLVHAIATANDNLLQYLISHGYDLDQNELTGPWNDISHFLTPDKKQALFAAGKDLQKHVHFLGRLDHNLLRFLFPCADIALFPSTFPEAYPLVIIESLANGVFPMASYFSGLADSIDSLIPFLGESIVNRMKISVKDEDRISSLITNVNSIISNSSIMALKPKLRQIAVENYDWSIIAAKMVEAYQSFI